VKDGASALYSGSDRSGCSYFIPRKKTIRRRSVQLDYQKAVLQGNNKEYVIVRA